MRHTIAGSLYAPLIIRALGTRQVFIGEHARPDARNTSRWDSCSAARSRSPCPISTALDHLVIIGANPLVSNGSLATAADFPAS